MFFVNINFAMNFLFIFSAHNAFSPRTKNEISSQGRQMNPSQIFDGEML